MLGLFVHDHKFPRIDEQYYYSSGFEKEFFDRYLSIFDELAVLARNKNINKSLINEKNIINQNIKFTTINNTKKIFRKKTRDKIKQEIKRSDYLVIRLPSILGLYAVWRARKTKTPYIIEVAGCAWDAISNMGASKVPAALLITYLMKKAVWSAEYVVYVTEEFLEKRYPTKGKSIPCSNVALNSVSVDDIDHRLRLIDKKKFEKKFIIGTCATIDVIYKGQQDVIKALAKLINEGYDIEYQLVGGGDSSHLRSVAEKYGVSERVKFIGSLEHKDVFKWLEQIDIYVHPSKQEGLSRAIIEAMSKGCPVFAASAGGINELIEPKYIFNKGNIDQICSMYKKFGLREMKEQAVENHNNSKKYLKPILDERRKDFFKQFIKNNSFNEHN